MRALRTWMLVLFAISALSCFGIVVRYTRVAFAPPDAWEHPSLLSLIIVLVIFSIVGSVFALGVWTGFREKPSARWWGMASGFILVLTALFPVFLYLRFDQDFESLKAGFSMMAVVFGAGVLGIVAFARPARKVDGAATNESAPRPGDGTIYLVNKAAGLLALAAGCGAYSWWCTWVNERNLWPDRSFLLDNVAFLAVTAAIIVVHETGHAIAGLALGMRLRLIALGPFQIKRFRCKWRFEFTRKLLVNRGGAIGLLPATAAPPHWHAIVIAAGGPAINLITGTIAIWASESLNNDALLESHGILALFGAMSLAIGLCNLVPFRLGAYYSDGARICQHAFRLPFGDLAYVLQAVRAVAETSLRTRDYDIEAIHRALQAYPSGTEGHYLKLYVFDSCFERGEFAEAAAALVEAEQIYDSCALKAETEISFVLGHGGLRDDATATRRWWERLESRNPDRTDAGYWLAKSAVNRVNGRPEDASVALMEAERIIAEMPQTGSRAYDVEWSKLLCKLIAEACEEASVAVS